MPSLTRRSAIAVLALGALVAMPAVQAQQPPGMLSTVAGSPSPGSSTSYGFGGDGGPATRAQLYQPRALAFDAAGNAFLADALNHRIRKIDTGGIITTVAGSGTAGFAGDGGPATKASLDTPHGVAVDAAGNIYIADSANHRIRKVDSSGTITTIAGNGTPGKAGVGAPAVQAQVKNPKTLITAPDGSLYFSDSGNNRVCRITPEGVLTVVAGNGKAGYSGDGGRADVAMLNTPTAVWRAGDGALLVADSDNHRVRRIDASGIINTVAGTGTPGSTGDGGPAVQAQLNDPRGVIVDSVGNVYVGEELGHRVRRIDSSGTITTLAGTGSPGYAGDGGPATNGAFDHVRGLAFDPAGNLWIADVFNNRIRMVAGVSKGTKPSSPPPAGNNGGNPPPQNNGGNPPPQNNGGTPPAQNNGGTPPGQPEQAPPAGQGDGSSTAPQQP